MSKVIKLPHLAGGLYDGAKPWRKESLCWQGLGAQLLSDHNINLKDFGLTEEMYFKHRCGLGHPTRWRHEDIGDGGYRTVSFLYLDADDGAMLFKTANDIFEENGFSVKLVDCNTCDISFDDMMYIVHLLLDVQEANTDVRYD